ncbi:unnamed protein product [Pseudo-nitzschia multistriata]|uniref:Uncharacterized protein n=1 Tax=Pseudo-nitzschia multistriata TaxID=183589 RepID=A0A448ZEB8_9STRA|nr:unnamed protein product [Pseudo-nitzschia multistriata]
MPAVNIVLRMVGGRGWDNDDFLSSLSGDEDERKKSREDYDDFSDRRASFNARQAEIMKSPQAQAFMKQRQEQQMRYLEEEQGQGDLSGDGTFLGGDVPEGSGGGTRMGRMMEQAKRMQGQRGQSNMIGGLHHQQLLGPLDEDDDEKKEV